MDGGADVGDCSRGSRPLAGTSATKGALGVVDFAWGVRHAAGRALCLGSALFGGAGPAPARVSHVHDRHSGRDCRDDIGEMSRRRTKQFLLASGKTRGAVRERRAPNPGPGEELYVGAVITNDNARLKMNINPTKCVTI